MKVKKLLISKWISLILLLQLISLVTTFECPVECSCTVLQKKNNEFYNHVKCFNVSGINDIDKLSSIYSLDLSNTKLLKISQRLDKLKNLTELNLSNNSLNDFSKLGKRVTTLDLSYNRIKSDKLSMIPTSIKYLDLSYNKITYIPREIMNLKSLKFLKLNENPINCNCETLEVRNWLQTKNITIDDHVKCAYPNKFRDTSLTDMNESDICENYISPTSILTWDETDENDIMLADSPFTESGSGENDDKDEELGKDFIPVNKSDPKGTSLDINLNSEGSGEGEGTISPFTEDDLGTTESDNDSGSGGIPPFETRDPVNEVIEQMTSGLGIYKRVKLPEEEPTTFTSETTEIIVMSAFPSDEHETIDPITNNTESNANMDMDPVKSGSDSKATYFLLIIFGCLVVGLIVFVALKKSRTQNRNRPKIIDPEKQLGTELSPMDKQNNKIGKPNENVPLMDKVDSGEYSKPTNGTCIDVPKTYEAIPNIPEASDDSPLLLPKEDEAKQTSYPDAEPNTTLPVADEQEKEPIHETSPKLSTFKSKPIAENGTEPKSLSPRYSPVYSPDTGRIKIKLIQTPKPKTPLLVTRSLSNAGDIITTPNSNQHL